MGKIKEFRKNLIVPMLIGLGVVYFVGEIIAPVFDLHWAMAAIIATAIMIIIICSWVKLFGINKEDRKTEMDNIYEEKIFSKWTTIILVGTFLFVLFLSVFLILIEPIKEPIQAVVLFVLLFVLLLLLAVMINFCTLSIKMTPKFIIVSYGIFKNKILWENIEDCYSDNASAIRHYGGWGIRIGRVSGKWRKVYNTIGEPRVVLLLKRGKFFKEFVFSTKNPGEVMKITKERIMELKVKVEKIM